MCSAQFGGSGVGMMSLPVWSHVSFIGVWCHFLSGPMLLLWGYDVTSCLSHVPSRGSGSSGSGPGLVLGASCPVSSGLRRGYGTTHYLPPFEQTNICKNITFLQLRLWAVIKYVQIRNISQYIKFDTHHMFTVSQSVNCETNRKPHWMWPALKRREKEDRAKLITATYDVTEDYEQIE